MSFGPLIIPQPLGRLHGHNTQPRTYNIYEYNSIWLEAHINEPGINADVRQVQYLATSITEKNKIAWLLKAIGFIDLTSLNGDDTKIVIERLCNKAVEPVSKLPFPWEKPIHTAAVCVYPSKVRHVVQILNDRNAADVVKVASVAAGFPSGQYPLTTRLEEVRYAIQYGAQEIDIVIDRSLVLEHNWKQLYDELAAIRNVCNEKENICLKTILSTGELLNLANVYKAAMVAMMAGADFIKTSTGKEAVNATLPAGVVMCRAITEFYRLSKGRKVGLKPAGGIKLVREVLEWMTLVKEELGNDWLTNTHFRIGASSLLDNIVRELQQTCKKDKTELTDTTEGSVEEMDRTISQTNLESSNTSEPESPEMKMAKLSCKTSEKST